MTDPEHFLSLARNQKTATPVVVKIPVPAFDRGDWVVQIRGRYRGRVGRLADHPVWVESADGKQIGHAVVQFGADGPFNKLKFASLRKADIGEIPNGVGK